MKADEETTHKGEGQREKTAEVWVAVQMSEGLPLQGARERLVNSGKSCHPTLKHIPKPHSDHVCADWPYVHGYMCLALWDGTWL